MFMSRPPKCFPIAAAPSPSDRKCDDVLIYHARPPVARARVHDGAALHARRHESLWRERGREAIDRGGDFYTSHSLPIASFSSSSSYSEQTEHRLSGRTIASWGCLKGPFQTFSISCPCVIRPSLSATHACVPVDFLRRQR